MVTSGVQSLFLSRGSIAADCSRVRETSSSLLFCCWRSLLPSVQVSLMRHMPRVERCRDPWESSKQASLVAGSNRAAGPRENGQGRPRWAQQVPHKYLHFFHSLSRIIFNSFGLTHHRFTSYIHFPKKNNNAKIILQHESYEEQLGCSA